MCAVGTALTFLFGSLVFLPSAEYPDLALECSALANAKADPVAMPSATAPEAKTSSAVSGAPTMTGVPARSPVRRAASSVT